MVSAEVVKKVAIADFNEFKTANTQAIADAVKGEADLRAAADTKVREDFAAADVQAVADAKAYTDEQIATIVALGEGEIDAAIKAVFGE